MTLEEVLSIPKSYQYYYELNDGKIVKSASSYETHINHKAINFIMYYFVRDSTTKTLKVKFKYNENIINIFTIEQIKEIYPEILI